MRDDVLAVVLNSVSKSYRLYPTPMDMVLDLSGMHRFLFWKKPKYPEYEALKSINLSIRRGHRIGIIGRNGAGKTTLLRLLTGNFLPTSGTIEVNGKVQALMDTGLGFHQDFAGIDNIKASLIYNGLGEKEIENAISDIVDFVELGEYLYQPLKTYSLGMQSRLGFATATAINPDILIIDEVLSAGDGYFMAKSAERMKRLTSGGTTLVLVSHSMPQIIQFCDEAIWLERGQIVMQGEALEVVKGYESFIRTLDDERIKRENQKKLVALQATEHSVGQQAEAPASAQEAQTTSIRYGGKTVSRWPGLPGLKISGFTIRDRERRETAIVDSGQSLEYAVELESESDEIQQCVLAINTYTLDGKQVLLDWTTPLECLPRRTLHISLAYEPLLLGNGDYVVSIGLYKHLDMMDTSTAIYYDIWDRSFQFKVIAKYPHDHSICKPPATWQIAS